MKITQWLLFIISLLLVCANLRMFGEQSIVLPSQEICIQVDDQKPACFKKLQAAQQFLTMLKYRAHERLTKATKPVPHRRFGLKNETYKSKNYLLALNKMHNMVQKYTDMAAQRYGLESEAMPAITIDAQTSQLDMPRSVPVIIETVQENDDSVQNSLENLSKKIDELYAERQKNAYMQTMRPVSPDMSGMQVHQWPQMGYPIQQSMPCPMMQYMQQPMMQPMQMQNQMNNAQAMAMQLQSSAMMMQQQASALLMQAQQQMYMPQQPMYYGMQQPMQMTPPQYMSSSKYEEYGNASFTPKELMFNSTHKVLANQAQNKQRLLLQTLNEIVDMGAESLHRLMQLINAEFMIIEQLLSGAKGAVIQQVVQKRDGLLELCTQPVKRAYNIIIDLASSSDDTLDPAFYNYAVKSSQCLRSFDQKSKKIADPRRSFLIKMMIALEHYYLIVENMQEAFKAAKD